MESDNWRNKIHKFFFIQQDEDYTLLNDQVDPDYQSRNVGSKGWRSLFRFIGPAYMIAVGYMDPGNWATDISAGSYFGYRLLYIVLASSLIGLLFQILCLKLGIVTGYDLAEQCRRVLNKPNWPLGRFLNYMLYALTELAIISTDLAEVLGSAIALQLLFGIPLVWGVVITSLDVLIILKWWGSKYQRVYEFFILLIVLLVGVCFVILLTQTKPDFVEVLQGFVPRVDLLFTDKKMLFNAVAILGATVMPHNLYLHASICKTRKVQLTQSDCEKCDDDVKSLCKSTDNGSDSTLVNCDNVKCDLEQKSMKYTLRYAIVDLVIALIIAFSINATILIVGASAFYKKGMTDVKEIQDAYYALDKYVGQLAAVMFGIALLASGQSSTITGTLAGQIVMNGFLRQKLRLVFRRLGTRLLAIVPALVIVLISGDAGAENLLVWSQVVLSIQLPFAVIPLVIFTSSKALMGGSDEIKSSEDNQSNGGEVFTNGLFLKSLAWLCTIAIIVLNIMLIIIPFTGLDEE